MATQKFPLRGNPIPWLLEEDHPSIRYRTLVELLDHPIQSPEVQEARETISQSPLVLEIFNDQNPTGFWGDDETKPYRAQGALGVLSLLHLLRVPPDERTARGCDSFLRFSQAEKGGFSLVKRRPSGIFPCTTGEHLPFLIYFGFGEDHRVRNAFEFIINSMSHEGALACVRYQHQDCYWGAIATLNGLKVLPDDMRSEKSQRIVAMLSKVLLRARYDFCGEHKRWLTFGVPRSWDLLSALLALQAHGYGAEPEFMELLEIVLDQQDDQGRWLCGSVSRTYPLEKRNRPSKWVTLDALRLLKFLGCPIPTP
jgi:hypothetical protein